LVKQEVVILPDGMVALDCHLLFELPLRTRAVCHVCLKLIPRSIRLLENIIFTQLGYKCHAFYGSSTFITVFSPLFPLLPPLALFLSQINPTRCSEDEDAVHILLKCSESRKWKEKLFGTKWLLVNEKVAYIRIVNYTNAVMIKKYRKIPLGYTCRWENRSSDVIDNGELGVEL
jgi:hypothetical protein